jgi:NAD(P)-dependent dehydrogenase (short-subunit alcohol dehydrogenase family)
MTSSDQTSSTALVTGASRGFGRAIGTALHAAGAKVVAVDRSAELLASLQDGDVRQAFHWIRDALLLPPRPGSLEVDEYIERVGPGLEPEDVGKATLDIVASADHAPGANPLTPAGLSPVG